MKSSEHLVMWHIFVNAAFGAKATGKQLSFEPALQ